MSGDLESLKIRRDGKKPPRRRKGWIAAILVPVVGAGAWFVLAQGRAVEVTVGTARPASAEGAATVLNASGYVTARRRATVSSKLTGKVVEVTIEEGMQVDAGFVVARLDDATQRAALALAEAQRGLAARTVEDVEARLRLAQQNLVRAQSLVANGVAGQADLDAAEAEFTSLTARLALAREQIGVAEREATLRRIDFDDTKIRAPFAGVVVSKDAQPGEMVSPVSAGGGFTRTGICTLVDMASLEIEVDVNESYIGRVVPEQQVLAKLDAYPDWKIPAHVLTTVPTADRQKATVKVRIAFDALDPKILPDMGVKVAFLDSHPEAAKVARLVVPRKAVHRDGKTDSVFVIAEGKAVKRTVKVGETTAEDAEIVEGLTDGEQVVVEGPVDLEDGRRVRPRS